MKRLYILALAFGLVFLLSFPALGSDLSASIYYDVDLKNSGFAYLGGLGLSFLGSSPLNQNLRFYYGIDSGFTGLGLAFLADLGIGKKIDINSHLNIEPVILINGGVNIGSPSFAGGVSGLIRFNMNQIRFSTGLKYLYLDQNYQYLFIPVVVGIIF